MFWQRVTGCSEADDNASGERVRATRELLIMFDVFFLHNLTNIFTHVFACQGIFFARLKDLQTKIKILFILYRLPMP